MSEFVIGASVEIQRSDGRVHPAVVSKITADLVTVEWYENGEAKGKEVDIASIYEFNPGFDPNNKVSSRTDPSSESQRSLPHNNNNNNYQNKKRVSKGPQNLKNDDDNNGTIEQQNNYHPRTNPPPSQQQPTKSLPPAPPTNQNQGNTQQSASNAYSKVPRASLGFKKPPVNANYNNGHDMLNYDIASFDDAPTYPVESVSSKNASLLPAPGKGRKSNCVKEVERIQQKREERRAAHKVVAPQYHDLDRSNPNYEFMMMIRDFQATLDYKPLTGNEPVETQRICVCVRKRPLNKKEISKKDIEVITIPSKNTVYLHEPRVKVDLTKYLENQPFHFDYAFNESCDNITVYKYTAKPLIDCIFNGGMATCFAYGQTGSGKTHTMGGEFKARGEQDCTNGIYALAATDVFKLIKSKYRSLNLFVECSFFEIYSGKVFDLLNKKEKLRILEDGKAVVNVVGLSARSVASVDDVLKLLQHGNAIRTSGTTSANNHSSRSHAVFQIILKRRDNYQLYGKFSLIDLAGNERGADTSSSDRMTRMEGAEINKSLLALKECIRALSKNSVHLPFRGSKLTQVLRDSFIGDNNQTCMIAMISPSNSCCENSLNTLRYADRVKELGPMSQNMASVPEELGGAGDDEGSEFNNNGDEDDDDAVGMLLSGNGEFTEDYVSFQRKVSHLESMEEEICDAHERLVDRAAFHKDLVHMTHEVDYDIDDYSLKLANALDEDLNFIFQLRQKVELFRKELKEEEAISNKIKNNKK